MAYYNSQYTGAEIDEALGKALTALQGGNLATVATTGSYSDLLNTPTLGTAAATDFTDYATAAQGALADTAVQPADLSTVATSGAYTDLTGLPTLGTAASSDSTAYATAAQGALADTAVQPSDITDFETTTELNARDTANRDRSNHTGTQLAATISDFSTAASAAAPVQPSDITDFETTTELNARDTANRDRTNHTGTQAASTITGLATIATTGAYSDLIGAPDLSTFDDVLLYANLAAFPVSGELGKVYVAEDSGYIYRWDGSAYVQLTDQTAIWGQISGTLSNQTDLQNALNTKLESTDIANFETTTELNARDTANRDRTNHTGTQLAATISDFSTAASAAAPVQPSDITDFETTTELNARDTANRDRTNHTGTQAASTITGLATIATSGSYNDLTDQPTFSSDLDGLTDVTITALTDEQILQYDAATSQWVNVDNAGGAGVPGGADTQVQFNDGGAFGGDSDFTYNKTTNELSLAGDIKLDDGSTFETIVQSVPATANQVISFPDATGIVALTSDLSVKVSSDPTGVTGADQITNMVSLTQAEYDNITPNASTFYVIVG